MRSISQISCSLNLGLVYSLDYSYDPRAGISMKLYFVREDGSVANYQPPLPLQKAYIQVGAASFAMYPVNAGIELAPGKRIQWVEFEDDFFRLKSFYVVLPGRGCGTNVFTLGRPVDSRTEAQKIAAAIDPVAQQIQTLTVFPDYEYTFNDFISLLRAHFPVSINATYNGTITRPVEGSFDSVLSDWCVYYNLSFFFENGTIKIFDPTRLTINLPTLAGDMVTYTQETDIRSTYGRTVCNWFQQNGGEYPLSQTSNTSGPIQVATRTLWPIGHEFGLTQNPMDLNQVAAAMYGMNYWFLYNFYNGSTSVQCGWTPISAASYQSTPAGQSVRAVNAGAAIVIPGVMEQRFEAYQQYGQSIAGRYYLSDRVDNLSTDQTYTWFNESLGPVVNFTGDSNKIISLDYLTPSDQSAANTVDGTFLNTYFSGINYVGNRLLYKDLNQVNLTAAFTLPSGTQALVDTTYQAITDVGGSESMNLTTISVANGGAQIVPYSLVTIPQDVSLTFLNPGAGFTGFLPRFPSISLKGIRTADYVTLQASQGEPNNVKIVNGTSGPNIVTNTSVLKTLQQGSYTVYYDKYLRCAYASSPNAYYGFRFDPHQVSVDNQINVTFNKLSNNTYVLQRDYAFINTLVNNPFLPTLAQPRTFPTRHVTFSLNYFYPVPVNFLSNGLVSMSVAVGDNGINASYTFSNEMLEVPDRQNQFDAYAQAIRNSWIQTYKPKEVIT